MMFVARTIRVKNTCKNPLVTLFVLSIVGLHYALDETRFQPTSSESELAGNC